MLASLATLLGPPPANAHPLGQNSINHLTLVRISSDRIALLYILDQAEFLTLRQRDLTEEQIIAFKLEEVQRRADFRRLVDAGLVTQRGRGRNTRYHASDALRADVPVASQAEAAV